MPHLFKYSRVRGAKCGGVIFRWVPLRITHMEIVPVEDLNILQRDGTLFATPFDKVNLIFWRFRGHLNGVGQI